MTEVRVKLAVSVIKFYYMYGFSISNLIKEDLQTKTISVKCT